MQSIVVEFILTHVDKLFGDTGLSGECPPAQHVTIVWGVPAELQGLGGHLDRSPILQMRKLTFREMLLMASWRRPGDGRHSQDVSRPLLLSVPAARSLAYCLALKTSGYCLLIPHPDRPVSWDLWPPLSLGLTLHL